MTITNTQSIPSNNNEQSIIVPPTSSSSSDSSPQEDLLSLHNPIITSTAIVPTNTNTTPYHDAEQTLVNPTIPTTQGPTYADILTSPATSAAIVASSSATTPSLLENQENSQPNNVPAIQTTSSPPTSTTTTTTIFVPPMKDATVPKDVQMRLHRMKRNRQANQAIAATAGTVAGLVVLGPIGAVVGGIAAHSVTKAAGRHREHKVRSKYSSPSRRQRQQGAVSANVKPLPQGVLV